MLFENPCKDKALNLQNVLNLNYEKQTQFFQISTDNYNNHI